MTAQMGHTDAAMTLGLYAKVMSTTKADQNRQSELVNGDYLAVAGSGSDPAPTMASTKAEGITEELAQ